MSIPKDLLIFSKEAHFFLTIKKKVAIMTLYLAIMTFNLSLIMLIYFTMQY